MRRRRPSVVLVLRREFEGRHSISQIYEGLFPHIQRHFPDARLLRMPCQSKGFWQRLRICWAIYRGQGQVTHLCGDLHYAARVLPARRTLLTLHTIYHPRPKGWKAWLFRQIWFRWSLPAGLHLSTVSEDLRQRLGGLLRKGMGPVALVHNPVDTARFPFSEKSIQRHYPRILIVGTRAGKNAENAIRALAGLPCHVRLIGRIEAPQRALLASTRADWSAAENLSPEAMASEYQAADLLLFPSLHESFGLPIIEAQAVGRPVVTSKFTAMPEVAGEGALFVDPHDVADIRRGVLDVIGEEGLAEALVAKGRANVERFDMTAVAARYVALYSNILLHR